MFRFKGNVDDVLNVSRRQVADERTVYLKSRSIVPQGKAGFSMFPARLEAYAGALFQDHLFVVSNQGLLQFDYSGRETRRYSALDGLPGNRLTALAAAPNALWIGAAPQGLLKFDGSRFEYFFAERAHDFEITALLALPSGELLLGTKQRGLLVFREDRATEFTPEVQAKFITCLAGNERWLAIGTLADGLFLYRQGLLSHLQKGAGQAGTLLDDHITTIALDAEVTYAGTPLGACEIRDGEVSRCLLQGLAIRSLALGRELVAATDQGLVSLNLRGSRRDAGKAPERWQSGDSGRPWPAPLPLSAAGAGVHQVLSFQDGWLAFSADGILQADSLTNVSWRRFGQGFAPRQQPANHSQTAERFLLSDSNVSALAIDRDQRLWVGYFDRGLDLFSAQGGRLLHQEDDRIFCVNHVQPLPDGRVAVSTANGLAFYEGPTLRAFFTEKEGLIHKSVAMVHPLDAERIVAATAEGLTIFEGGRPSQNLFVLHGLASNHLYCAASLDGRTYLGTLGGISVLQNSQILFSWNTANSGLAVNWVNAVASLQNRIYVGTYGGGVQSVDSDGQWTDFSATLGTFEVNPNAMAVDEERLYVGTLDRGFFIYDARRNQWQHEQQGLPSQNVTAFAFAAGAVLVGTDLGVVRIQKEALRY